MTFKEYLAQRRAGYDAQGDFVRLANADTAMPDVSTWDELRAYIERSRSYEAVEAARKVWDDYQAESRRVRSAQGT